MLRISQEPTTNGHTTLRLEGELTGLWVDEMRRECARALDCNGHSGPNVVVLDLAEVSSLDAAGIALIRELDNRITLKNCSPYVAELLKDVRHVEK